MRRRWSLAGPISTPLWKGSEEEGREPSLCPPSSLAHTWHQSVNALQGSPAACLELERPPSSQKPAHFVQSSLRCRSSRDGRRASCIWDELHWALMHRQLLESTDSRRCCELQTVLWCCRSSPSESSRSMTSKVIRGCVFCRLSAFVGGSVRVARPDPLFLQAWAELIRLSRAPGVLDLGQGWPDFGASKVCENVRGSTNEARGMFR